MTDQEGGYSRTIARAVSNVESAIYLLAALFLVVMAAASFFIVARDLSRLVLEGATIDIIYVSLNDLLVVLIIVELIQTIVVFVQRHELDLRLIIAAGLTAMIRRVLVFGVEKISWQEMLVTAVLIAILAAAIYLISREKIAFKK